MQHAFEGNSKYLLLGNEQEKSLGEGSEGEGGLNGLSSWDVSFLTVYKTNQQCILHHNVHYINKE